MKPLLTLLLAALLTATPTAGATLQSAKVTKVVNDVRLSVRFEIARQGLDLEMIAVNAFRR